MRTPAALPERRRLRVKLESTQRQRPRHHIETRDRGQVFWLTDRPTDRTFSVAQGNQWFVAAFVPDYSGGSAVDFHHLPFYAQSSGRRKSRSIHLSKVGRCFGNEGRNNRIAAASQENNFN